MHAEYHKINSVFKRDPSGKNILWGEFSDPEVEYLQRNDWTWTEKVDGTCIRVAYDADGFCRYGGKTDEAQVPAKLFEVLVNTFTPIRFSAAGIVPGITLYGEGYGAGIQKGGVYRPDQSFVLFDVRVGDWWLQRDDVNDVAKRLGVEVVPILNIGSLEDMLQVVEDGFTSQFADTPAEGIVARPFVELKTRAGRRIITKMKHRDFVGVSR